MKKTRLLFVGLLLLSAIGLNAQDWGASPDGDFTSVLGDWNISADSVFQNTLVMTTPNPNRLFYRAGDKLANYTVKADVRLLEMQEVGAYPKYGFFPVYKDTANWIWVFMHPMASENGISVVAMIDNVYTIVWQTFVWGELNVTYTEDNELKITKADSQFTVYVNGSEKASFQAAIDSGWVGLCTDAVRVNYKNFSVVNNDATGIPNLTGSSAVNIFPNPVSDVAQIHADYVIHDIEIYTISGQKVAAKKQINSRHTSYDISSLDNGVYLMNIITEKGVEVKKLIVKK